MTQCPALGPVRIGLMAIRYSTHGKRVVTAWDSEGGPVMMTLWEKDGMTQCPVLGQMKIGLMIGLVRIGLMATQYGT